MLDRIATAELQLEPSAQLSGQARKDDPVITIAPERQQAFVDRVCDLMGINETPRGEVAVAVGIDDALAKLEGRGLLRGQT